jgi:hypothetical protein
LLKQRGSSSAQAQELDAELLGDDLQKLPPAEPALGAPAINVPAAFSVTDNDNVVEVPSGAEEDEQAKRNKQPTTDTKPWFKAFPWLEIMGRGQNETYVCRCSICHTHGKNSFAEGKGTVRDANDLRTHAKGKT